MFNKHIPYFALSAWPAEHPHNLCVPGAGMPPGRDSGGQQTVAALGHSGGQAT